MNRSILSDYSGQQMSSTNDSLSNVWLISDVVDTMDLENPHCAKQGHLVDVMDSALTMSNQDRSDTVDALPIQCTDF